jgi:hypothetical protein
MARTEVESRNGGHGRFRATIVIGAHLAAWGCTEASQPTESAEPPILETLYGPCFVEHADVCFIHEPLGLWARTTADARLEVHGLARASEPKPEAIDGGLRWRLSPPSAPRTVTLRAVRGSTSSSSSLRVAPLPPEIAAVREASEASLPSLVATTSTGNLARCLGLGRIARARLYDDVEVALPASERSMRCFDALGSPTEVMRDRLRQSFILQRAGRLTKALKVLGEPPTTGDSTLRAAWHQRRGTVWRDLGNPSESLRAWRDAEVLASRVGALSTLISTLQSRVPVLQQMGRTSAAKTNGRALLGRRDQMSDALLARVLTNVAWASFIDRDGRMPFGPSSDLSPPGPAWPDPTPLQREANPPHLAAGHPDRHANGELNLALFALHSGDLEAAAAHLGAVSVEHLIDVQRLWMQDARGELAHRRGACRQSLEIYEDLANRATGYPEVAWRAEVGAGQALECAGEPEAARSRYLAAEAILERDMAALAVGRGRLGFLAQRDQSARLALDVSVRLGDVERAESVARGAIGRAWRSLRTSEGIGSLSEPQRDEWNAHIEDYERARARLRQLVASARSDAGPPDRSIRARREELKEEARRALESALSVLAIRPHRLEAGPPRVPERGRIVTIFPGRDTWVALVRSPSGVEAVSLGGWRPEPDLSAAVWSERVLGPLEPHLEGGRSFRFVVHPWLADVDLHALTLREEKLIERGPVVFELAAGLTSTSPGGRPLRVLVAADPTGDLLRARAEGAAIAKRYESDDRYEVRHLEGSTIDAATLKSELMRSDLFHFAGHAQTAAGGLDSGLILADGERLTVADILTLPRTPAIVVLSACKSSKLGEPGAPADVGLAQAFAIRGARQVVAAQRLVEDELAEAISLGVHRDPTNVARSLQHTQARLATERPGSDWAAFRVFAP